MINCQDCDETTDSVHASDLGWTRHEGVVRCPRCNVIHSGIPLVVQRDSWFDRLQLPRIHWPHLPV